LVATPLKPEKEESETADGKETAKIVDTLENLFFGQTLNINSRRRPIEDGYHEKRSPVDDKRDPSPPSPRRRGRVQLSYSPSAFGHEIENIP